MISKRATIAGRVQGVGYRGWLADRAEAYGLNGWVRNQPDGTVAAMFSGSEEAVEAILAECSEGPPAARVSDVTTEPGDEIPPAGFRVTG